MRFFCLLLHVCLLIFFYSKDILIHHMSSFRQSYRKSFKTIFPVKLSKVLTARYTSFSLELTTAEVDIREIFFQLYDSNKYTYLEFTSALQHFISFHTAIFLHNYTCQSFEVKLFEPLEK